MTKLAMVKDIHWVRNSAFMVPTDAHTSAIYEEEQFKSSSSYKFYSTGPGEWRAINPPPQFGPTADITLRTREAESRGGVAFARSGNGMGRWWAENIDDPAQIVTCRFGVPKFTSMSSFFTGFYNGEAGQLARTGRSASWTYTVGKVAGFLIPLFNPVLLALLVGGSAVRYLLNKPTSRFYSLKSDMPSYWNAVQTITNAIAVNSGIVPRQNPKDWVNIFGSDSADMVQAKSINKTLHSIHPDIFFEDGGVNVYAMATKYMRRARHDEKRKQDILDSNNWENKRYQDVIKAMGETVVTPEASKMSKNYNQYIESWFKTAPATPRIQSKTLGTDSEGNIVAAGPGDPTVVQLTETVPQKIEGDKVVGDEAATAGLLEHIASSFDDGTEIISFAVDAANSFSDSFGNSFRSTDIEEKINSMSSSAKNMKFNLAGGNVSDTISAALGWATDMVKDAAAGFMDGMQISGLAVLGGAGLVDIPQHWDSSSTSIGKTSYTMKLIPVTNHPIARLLHQIIPLACVLAAVLPKSTGKQSYTSPFICEYYDKGRAQDRLAMFESVSVRRGITNTPYNLAGETLGIEVSFTIASMSKMLHMPISANFSMNPLKGVFDEETIFTDYMAILSGLGMEDQVYNWRRLTLNLARKSVAWDSYWNKARFGMFVRNLPVVNMLDVFYAGRR